MDEYLKREAMLLQENQKLKILIAEYVGRMEAYIEAEAIPFTEPVRRLLRESYEALKMEPTECAKKIFEKETE